MVKHLLCAVMVAAVSSVAFADFSTKTHQAPASVVISAATKGMNGNAVVTWTEPLKVTKAERYIGHGKKGFVQKMDVGAAKRLVLKDVAKNGGRFNLVADDGLFLHIECGGNKKTTEPKLQGLEKDCSFVDVASGQKVGALVVTGTEGMTTAKK